MLRAKCAAVVALAAACGSAPRPAAPPAPARLEPLALESFARELASLGWRVEPDAPRDGVRARRDDHAFYLSLRVESSSTERGPKMQVRLSVFGEPGHALVGDVAPWAIRPGMEAVGREREDLVRHLGRRAADQFAEQFGDAR